MDLLKVALNGIDTNHLTLLSIGGREPAIEADLHHVHLGTVRSNLLLSVFYSLADLFVIPSRQDNLPNTVLESLACGTPVVGFEVGGIPDMVRSHETGWLAQPENPRSLRTAIEAGLSNDISSKDSDNPCRQVVESEYALNTQAKSYHDLYTQMIS
jgi:glycosyltransferase involved in cell wall biosynthesis